MDMTTSEETHIYEFKWKYVLGGIVILLFLMAIFSYSPEDTAILDGGVNGRIRNWGGLIGAWVSFFFFHLFGLATYPIAFLLSLSAIRSLIPHPMKRKGYFFSFLAAALGITLLMAIAPVEFASATESLGIGRKEQGLLALSGGALGAFFAAPETEVFPAGFLRMYIGMIGTTVASCVLLIAGLIFLFIADWKDLLWNGVSSSVASRVKGKFASSRQNEEEEEEGGSPLIVSGRKEKKRYRVEMEEEGEEEPIHSPSNTPLNEVEMEEEEENMPGMAASSRNTALKVVPQEEMEEEEEAEELPPAPARELPHTPRNEKEPEANNPYLRETPSQVVKSSLTAQAAYNGHFELPSIPMLEKPPENLKSEDASHLEKAKAILQATLDSFDIAGKVTGTVVGPRITRFEISLEPGIKVDKVSNIQNNIAMEMCATSVRVLAPIPGKNAVGIEVPNKVSNMVFIRELFESEAWRNSQADIPIILGKDVAGKVMITDLAKAPHLLIAGSTGSGKSVCMNTLVMSLLYKFSPFDLKLIMVDPKFVELEIYRPLPHLITPVVNDPKKVPFALRWGVNEMEHRYQMLARVKAKNLNAFNSRQPENPPVPDENGDPIPAKLPYLIIIVDELADIMMTEAKGDVETSICRIAQKGRAAGIHLVIATQTPRKDIITGTIKANLPTKISFKVSNFTDSRVILDTMGAEKLLGKGDMLFKGPAGEMERIQGSMVSDPEIQKTVDFVSSQVPQSFNETVLLDHDAEDEDDSLPPDDGRNSFPEETFDEDGDDGMSDYIRQAAAKYLRPGDDEKLRKALEIMLREGKVSTSYLQRRMTIGYNTAAEIIDAFEKRGIVSPPLPGGQKRTILVFDELGKPDVPRA